MKTEKTESTAPGTGHQTSPAPSNDWLTAPELTDSFWTAALEGQTHESTPIQRILCCIRYHGYDPDWDEAHRLANIAWANGAVLATTDDNESYLDQWAHLSGLGRHLYETAQTIYPGIYHLEPIIRQRYILEEAVARIGSETFGTVENLFVAALHAGRIGIEESDLQTGLLSVPKGYSADEFFLMNICLMDSVGLNLAEQRESVAWVLGSFYRRNGHEYSALTEASANSITLVRQGGGSLLEFLADGFVQGGNFARGDRAVVRNLLEETGELGKWSTLNMFRKFTRVDPGKATFEDAWQALLEWFPIAHGEMLAYSFHQKGLYIAHHCYDFLFWFGVIRQLIRYKLVAE